MQVLPVLPSLLLSSILFSCFLCLFLLFFSGHVYATFLLVVYLHVLTTLSIHHNYYLYVFVWCLCDRVIKIYHILSSCHDIQVCMHSTGSVIIAHVQTYVCIKGKVSLLLYTWTRSQRSVQCYQEKAEKVCVYLHSFACRMHKLAWQCSKFGILLLQDLLHIQFDWWHVLCNVTMDIYTKPQETLKIC